jgi:RNA polymerase sigma-B factor
VSEELRRLRREQDRALFARYSRKPTPQLRDAIVERFLPLVRALALRYARGTSEPLDDLVQVGAIGLVKAIERYDVARGVAFTSYAVPTIVGEIKRHFRDRTWSVHVPRGARELSVAVDAERAALEGRLGRTPTIAELAAALDLSDEDVLDGLYASGAHRAVSLEAPLHAEDGDEAQGERIGGDDRCVRQAETRAALDALMRTLPRRSRLVLVLRFERDMTQPAIAQTIGVSQVQVSRIVRAALADLHAAATASGATAAELLAA